MGSGVDPGGGEGEKSGTNQPLLHRSVFHFEKLCKSHKAPSFADEEKFLPAPLKTVRIPSRTTTDPQTGAQLQRHDMATTCCPLNQVGLCGLSPQRLAAPRIRALPPETPSRVWTRWHCHFLVQTGIIFQTKT